MAFNCVKESATQIENMFMLMKIAIDTVINSW